VVENVASLRWLCQLIRRKQVSFIVLQLRLWLAGFSRVDRVNGVSSGMVRATVRIRVTFIYGRPMQ